MSVVIVGAGLAGLSAACHLAGRGYDVEVIEREPIAGGRAGRLDIDGYTFDTGPTVLTMPGLIERALGAVGVDLETALPLTRLDPAYRGVFADADDLYVRAGREAMAQEIRDKCGPADAAAFDDYVSWLEELYRLEMPHFIETDFNSLTGLAKHPLALARLVQMGGFGKLGPLVRQRFADERLHKLFSFQAMYAGLSPEKALAIYAVITYMDCIEGVWTSPGGMHAVPLALQAAAEKAGVRFRFDTAVSAVLRSAQGRVAGVRTSEGEQVRADAVVATPDLPWVYEHLLPDLPAPRVLDRGSYSPSCVVWHVGARGAVPAGAAHHNIHFGRDWGGAFTALIDDRTLMPDPSRFLAVPSLSDPAQAPAGGHTIYVLEPVPHLGGETGTPPLNWEREAGPLRDRLLTFLADAGYPSDIVAERLVTPDDWQAAGMRNGTPFALSHTFFQTGPFRPKNVEKHLPGMFFAGSATVPGVGVPMVLISGELVAARVAGYLP